MRRLVLSLGAALFLVAGSVPAMSQDPDTPDLDTETWEGTVGPEVAETSTFDLSGSFEYKTEIENHERTLIAWLRAAAPTDAGEECQTSNQTIEKVATVEPSGDPEPDPTTLSFTVPVTSPCNITIDLTVSVVACTSVRVQYGDCWDSPGRHTFTKTLPVDAPPTPVTDTTASVEDTKTKDVNVSWTLPEAAEPDTTYSLERAGPDPGDEPEWTTIAPVPPPNEGETTETTEEDQGSETEPPPPIEPPIVDTVENDGVYWYRIVGERPEASSADSEEPMALVVAGTAGEVRVGKPPPTTTTTTPSSSTVTQPDSATTITVPRLGSSQTPDRTSTHTTVTVAPRSPVTTIDTGFEETLDYGDREDSEPGELAAEGQSIISSDDDSVVGPGAVAASLMVLVGWAGHVVYFRRLASQF